MKKKIALLGCLVALAGQSVLAQSLDKMQWFNEPEKWEVKNNTLNIEVTPKSDYWRVSNLHEEILHRIEDICTILEVQDEYSLHEEVKDENQALIESSVRIFKEAVKLP